MKIVINITVVLTIFVAKSKRRTMCLSNSAAQIHCVNIWNSFSPLSSAEAQRVFSVGVDPLSNVSAGTELQATTESA